MSIHTFQCQNTIWTISPQLAIAIITKRQYQYHPTHIPVYPALSPTLNSLPMRVTCSLPECCCFDFVLFAFTLSLRPSRCSPMVPGILPMDYHTGACGSVDPSSSAVRGTQHFCQTSTSVSPGTSQLQDGEEKGQLHYSFNMLFCNLVQQSACG